MLGTIDITDILADGKDVVAESMVEEPNLSEAELSKIEKVNALELKIWNIVKCSTCRKTFDMLKCKYSEGNLVCPHCHNIN